MSKYKFQLIFSLRPGSGRKRLANNDFACLREIDVTSKAKFSRQVFAKYSAAH